MSLRERRGNFLQPQSKVKRTESYFALPVSLRNNSETALSRILTYGKGALSSLSSRFWEFVNPQVELSVQSRPVEYKEGVNETKTQQIESWEGKLPIKRESEDWVPVCVKKRATVKESVEVQTDPYVDLKMPKRINLVRNAENCKNVDSFGDMDTKGTDDDEEDCCKGKKVRRVKKSKIWIDRQPCLEIIPEKSSEWKTVKKTISFMEPKLNDPIGQNLSIFSQPKQKETIEISQPTGLFAWSNKNTEKTDASPSNPLIQILKDPEPRNASIPSIFLSSPSKPSQFNSLFPSITQHQEINSTPSDNALIKTQQTVPTELIKTQQIPHTEPLNTPDSSIGKLAPDSIQQSFTNDLNTKKAIIPESTQLTETKPSLNQSSNSSDSNLTHQIPLNTVIENVAQNPFLNKSIANTQAASYKFGEFQSNNVTCQPMPSMPMPSMPMPSMPMPNLSMPSLSMPSFSAPSAMESSNVKVSTDIEMNSYAPCDGKRNENSFQTLNFPQNGFQMSFTPINLFPVASPVVGSGLFGAAPTFTTNQNAIPQPKSTGFNLGVVSTQNGKRGRK